MPIGRSLRRTGKALALLALLALAAPGAAAAHLRSGTVATDYRASVRVPPRLRSALAAQVYQSDRALHLVVRPGHTVVVEGYLGEPLLRIDARGLAVDVGSPTAAAVGLLERNEHVSGPATDWRLRSGRRDAVWHDRRVQSPPSGSASRFWSVPLVVDGRPAQLSGETRRVPRPSLLVWIALASALALAGALIVGAQRRSSLRPAALVFGLLAAAATLVSAAGFALDRYASPGSWLIGANEAVFALVGAGVLLWGPEDARGPAGVGLGLVGLCAAATGAAAFLHGVVLSAIPATDTRAAVVLALGAGVGSAVCGGLIAARTLAAGEIDPWPPPRR